MLTLLVPEGHTLRATDLINYLGSSMLKYHKDYVQNGGVVVRWEKFL